MHRKTLRVSSLAALLSLAALATAGEIYRYVDAEGNVHYVDRPTGADTEQRVAIASRPSDGASARAQMQARYNLGNEATGETTEDADAASDAEQPLSRADRIAAERERRERCEQYRARLETFVTSRRLYREDENGERVYLNDDERQEARDKVEELIQENCD